MHNKCLYLPGEGTLEIKEPPGSLKLPLEKTPSGHLALVVDDYAKLTKKVGGLPPRSVDFVAFPDEDSRSVFHEQASSSSAAAPPRVDQAEAGDQAAQASDETLAGSTATGFLYKIPIFTGHTREELDLWKGEQYAQAKYELELAYTHIRLEMDRDKQGMVPYRKDRTYWLAKTQDRVAQRPR